MAEALEIAMAAVAVPDVGVVVAVGIAGTDFDAAVSVITIMVVSTIPVAAPFTISVIGMFVVLVVFVFGLGWSGGEEAGESEGESGETNERSVQRVHIWLP